MTARKKKVDEIEKAIDAFLETGPPVYGRSIHSQNIF
jgi:hypothetical protein